MKWSVGIPWNPGGTTASNIAVSGGNLNLSTLRVNSSTFNGATIATENTSYNELFGLTYGYVEASIKLCSVPGSWPTFWMLESGWPPELDISEDPVFVSGTNLNQYSDNIHYTNSSGGNSSLGNGVHDPGLGNLTTGFHNYGMKWTPSSVTFYIDGNVQSTITDSTAIANLVKSGGGPMYLIFSQGGGSGWPGTPSESQWPDGTSSVYQVNWVRVWKDSSGSASSVTWNNTASNGVGNWTSGGAWSGGVAPQIANQTAIFGANAVSSSQTVNWNYSQTVGGLTFNSATGYTIGNGGGSLMLASSSGSVLVQATSGSTVGQTINSRVELYNNGIFRNSMTGGQLLTINGKVIDIGSQTLTADGAGTVVLAGANTYSGSTSIASGTLVMANPSALGSGEVFVSNGGTLVVRTNGGDTPYVMHVGSNQSGTITSDVLVGGTGINHIMGALFIGSNSLLNIAAGGNVASGSPAITLGNVSMSSGFGAGLSTFNPTTANVNIGSVSSTTNSAKTLVLDGTSGNNSVTGNISNGTNSVSVTKSNSSTWTLVGANTYTGTTSITGGRLILNNSGLPNTSGVALGSGATLTAEGNITTGGAMNAMGTLDLIDGTVNTLSISGALTLNNAAIDLEVGSVTADRIAASGAAVVSGTTTINIGAAPGQNLSNGGSYTILTASGGLSAANFKVGAKPGSLGFYSFAVSAPTSSALVVSVSGNPAPAVVYWTGKASTTLGDAANNWGSGPSINTSNWSTDAAGANDPLQLPDSNSTVIFTAANAAGSGALSTQLDSAYAIQGLTFDVPAATGISSAVLNTNSYTLSVGSGGIAVAPTSNSSATISGNGAVLLSGNQNWANNSNSLGLNVTTGISPVSGATTLSVTGTGAGGVNLSGVLSDGPGAPGLSTVFNQAGTTTLSAVNTYTGTTTVSSGLVVIASTGKIISDTTINGGTLELNGGSDAIGDAATVAVQSGGVLDIRAATAGAAKTEAIALLTGGGTVARGNAGATTLTVGATGLSGTFSGTIQNGNGSFALVKTGGGTLALAATSAYSGGTTITDNGGSLLVTHPGALGTGNVTIGNGNTNQDGVLQISGGIAITSVPTINFESRYTTDAGGSADIENVSGNNSLAANFNINMTGGSSVNILSTAGSLTLNGNFSSTGLSTSRGFDFYGAGNGRVNGVISDGSAQPTFVQMDGPGTWTLAGNNTYSGSTTVNGGLLVFTGNNNFGSGGVTVNGGTASFLASNTFTGAIALNGGTVIMGNPAALGSGSISLASGGLVGGTLVVQTSGGDTPYNIKVGSTDTLTLVSDVKTAGAGINHTLGTLSIGEATTVNVLAGNSVAAGNPSITLGNITLSSGFGPGPTTFNPTTASIILGAVTTSTTTAKQLVLDGTNTGNVVAGAITNGTKEIAVIKSNSSTWTLAGASTYTGGTTVGGGVLNVSGAVTASATDSITSVANAAGGAVLNITGTMTQYTINLGGASGGAGAVIQSSGSVATALAAGRSLAIGDIAGGYGYYKLAAGGLTTQETQIGSWGPTAGNNGGSGILEVDGGTLNNLGWLVMTRSAAANAQVGVLNLSGGLINYNGSGLQANWGTGQTAVINVRGGTLATANNTPIGLNWSNSASNRGILNLDGGVVQPANITGGSAVVNFNGGTLRAISGTTSFISVGSAYIYGGGATIDTNGYAVTIGQNLLAPSGSGVTAGGLTVSGSGYIAPPIVSIADPTGNGATAVASIDANGNLTAITITNPGVGYTSPTFSLIGGGGSGGITGTALLLANSSGGLTKTGTGTLTLSGTNTYTGLTAVLGGTLVVTSPNSLVNGDSLYVGSAASFFAPVTPSPDLSSVQSSAVPEPSTLALLAAGAASVLAIRWMKRVEARVNLKA